MSGAARLLHHIYFGDAYAYDEYDLNPRVFIIMHFLKLFFSCQSYFPFIAKNRIVSAFSGYIEGWVLNLLECDVEVKIYVGQQQIYLANTGTHR
jgi:hypothetical protein